MFVSLDVSETNIQDLRSSQTWIENEGSCRNLHKGFNRSVLLQKGDQPHVTCTWK